MMLTFDSIRTGSTITFSADCDDEHIPVWKLSDGKTYVGRVFYYTVQTPKFSFTNNVELTFEKSSYVLGGGNKDATRGKVVPQIEVFAPSGSILHQPSSSTDGSTPAEGAMVYIDGLENCVGVVDDRGKVKFHNVDADGNLSKEEVQPKVTADISYENETLSGILSYDIYYYKVHSRNTAQVVYKGHTYYCELFLSTRGRVEYFFSGSYKNLPFTASGRINLDFIASGDIQPTGAEAYSVETQSILPETVSLF